MNLCHSDSLLCFVFSPGNTWQNYQPILSLSYVLTISCVALPQAPHVHINGKEKNIEELILHPILSKSLNCKNINELCLSCKEY